jgi:putative transposase
LAVLGCPSSTSEVEVLRRPLEPCQFTSIRYGERLAEIGAAPSIGSVGDSRYNALAEPMHNLCKRELVMARRPWKTIDGPELATLGWLAQFNRERLHATLDDVPPVEHEAAFHAAANGPHQPVGIQ